MNKFVLPPRLCLLFLAAAALAALVFALISQYGFGLEPCILCIYQRWPYVAAALIGVGGFFLSKKSARAAAIFLVLVIIAYLVDAAIAFYHVGVEQRWWISAFEACAVPLFDQGQDTLEQILARPPARCDEVAFRFLGVSMAGWNMVYALLFTTYGIMCLTRRQNRI